MWVSRRITPVASRSWALDRLRNSTFCSSVGAPTPAVRRSARIASSRLVSTYAAASASDLRKGDVCPIQFVKELFVDLVEERTDAGRRCQLPVTQLVPQIGAGHSKAVCIGNVVGALIKGSSILVNSQLDLHTDLLTEGTPPLA